MPVPISTGRAASDASDRIPMLERELASLRRDLEALRGKAASDQSHGSLMAWIGPFVGGLAILLALAALLRH